MREWGCVAPQCGTGSVGGLLWVEPDRLCAVRIQEFMLFKTCLETLGVKTDPSEIDFAHVRKAYLRAALASHPDKNDGDQAKFVAVQEAFESVKQATNNGTIPLSSFKDKTLDAATSIAPPRSAAFYEAAAAALPVYK